MALLEKALTAIRPAIPDYYQNEIAHLRLAPLKSKYSYKDIVKNETCINLEVEIKPSMYYPNGGTAVLCRILNDTGCFFFQELEENGAFYDTEQDFPLLQKAVVNRLSKMFPADTFGCCGLYEECSNAGHCIHANPFYANACMYKKNLDAGRNFYRTISIDEIQKAIDEILASSADVVEYGKHLDRENNTLYYFGAHDRGLLFVKCSNNTMFKIKTKAGVQKFYIKKLSDIPTLSAHIINAFSPLKSSESTSTRDGKGKSLLEVPLDYTVVDIETSGVNCNSCDIIELSALRVRNGEPAEAFSSLVQPLGKYPYFVDDFITRLTGITNDMLMGAPAPAEVIPQFAEFIGDDILIGHNINFDVNFIYDAFVKHLGRPLSNDFIDTLRIARKMLPELRHHRLADVSAALGVSYEGAHRSSVDCEITNRCYLIMRERALLNCTERRFASYIKNLPSRESGDRRSDMDISTTEPSSDHPLFGKVVVFTGELDKMSRREAMQAVESVGGTNGSSVTKDTNYLVVGTTEYIRISKDGKTTKLKKAEDYLSKGQDIQIISEETFFQLLNGK